LSLSLAIQPIQYITFKGFCQVLFKKYFKKIEKTAETRKRAFAVCR